MAVPTMTTTAGGRRNRPSTVLFHKSLLAALHRLL